MPDNQVKANAKLGFKVGTQAAVNSILLAGSGAVHGSFYLAADTHRLYVGNEDTSLSPVNEGITTISTISELPAATAANAGQFYYITGETGSDAALKNVLTVSNGSNWVHINANTDTFIRTNGFSTYDISTNTVDVSSDITQSNNAVKSGRFRLAGSNGISISASTTTITVDNQSVTVPVLTISGDTYTLSTETPNNTTNTVKVKLDSTNTNNDSEITLTAGPDAKNNNNLEINDSNGTITLSSRDTRNSTVGISNDAAGFTVTVTDNYNTSRAGSFDPKIQLGTHTPVSFNSGTATLDVYTKDEIDSTLQVLNAMTYKGTLGSGGTGATGLNSTTWAPMDGADTLPVSVGDTYLVISSQVYGSGNDAHEVLSGSLMIARGTEDPTTGHITGTVSWDIVEASSDTDTTYKFVSTATGLVLRASTGRDTGELVVTNGTGINVSFTSDTLNGTANAKQTVTVTHADVTRTDTTGTAQLGGKASTTNTFTGETTIPVITAINTNSQGHVTGIETTDYTVYDTNSRITASTYTSTAYTSSGKKVGTISHAMTETFGNGSTNTVTTAEAFSSESLTITTDNTNGATSTDSSQISGLNIELLWGSF